MIWACPRPGCGGRVTPANSGSLDATGVVMPFGIHQILSPAFMSYAVTPPNGLGLRIETPPIVVPTARPSKLLPRSQPVCETYPGGAGSAPNKPQLSCGELYRNSEHGSFCTWIVLRALWLPT